MSNFNEYKKVEKNSGSNNKFKDMSLEELMSLKEEIAEEIKSRNKTSKVIYNTTFSYDSSYHLSKYKHWAKIITDIDVTKTNLYAFIGEWLYKTGENLVDDGSYILELDDNTKYTLYRINGDKVETLAEGRHSELISFINECNNIINGDDVIDELKD